MAFHGFITRKEIGLRSPRFVSYLIDASQGGIILHYAGDGLGHLTHSQCLSFWRGFQNWHMDKNGWSDIAYTVGICRHGYVLAGRGLGVRTAANGTNYTNYRFIAMCYIGGKGDVITEDALDAAWWFIRTARRGNVGDALDRHGQYRVTECPGDFHARVKNHTTEDADMAQFTANEAANLKKFLAGLDEVDSNPRGFAKYGVLLVRAMGEHMDELEFTEQLKEAARSRGFGPKKLAAIVDSVSDHLEDHPDAPELTDEQLASIVAEVKEGLVDATVDEIVALLDAQR